MEKEKKKLDTFLFHLISLLLCPAYCSVFRDGQHATFHSLYVPLEFWGGMPNPFIPQRPPMMKEQSPLTSACWSVKELTLLGSGLTPNCYGKIQRQFSGGKREIRGPDCFGFPLPFPQADYAAAGTHTCLIDSCLCLHAVLVLSALGGCYLTLGPRKLHWLLCQESMVLVGEIQQAVPSGERRAGTKGSQVPVFR